MPDNPLLLTAAKYRARLDKLAATDVQRLVDVYISMAARLKDKIDLLVLEIEKVGYENITRGMLVRMDRYKQLMSALSTELERYSVYLQTEVDRIANQAISQAMLDAASLARISVASAGATAALNKLPENAIRQLLGFLEAGSPMDKRLTALAPEMVKLIGDKILDGVGLGYNPEKVAKMIVSDLGLGLSGAMRWARTTQMWTYREASRATMAANSDVLDGWIWFAILDDAVPPCESCLANHGELFPLSETLDDHWNGRCVALPHVKGDDNPVGQSGEEWFNALTPEQQAGILGQGKLDALNEGKFSFGDLTKRVDDDVFGSMKVGVPLKDLIGDE